MGCREDNELERVWAEYSCSVTVWQQRVMTPLTGNRPGGLGRFLHGLRVKVAEKPYHGGGLHADIYLPCPILLHLLPRHMGPRAAYPLPPKTPDLPGCRICASTTAPSSSTVNPHAPAFVCCFWCQLTGSSASEKRMYILGS